MCRLRRMICTSSRDKARTLLCNKRQNTGSSEESSSLTSLVSTVIIGGASLNAHDGSTIPTITQDEHIARTVQQVLPTRMFFWNSQDACNLFGVALERPNGDVRDALKIRIELLQSVSNDHNGWRNVIEGRDPENICSGFDFFHTRLINYPLFCISDGTCTHE